MVGGLLVAILAGLPFTAGTAVAQPPVPWGLRIEVSGPPPVAVVPPQVAVVPPQVAMVPPQVVVRRGLLGRPRMVMVGPGAVPLPPFVFPGIPVPPWVALRGPEIVVESPPTVIVEPADPPVTTPRQQPDQPPAEAPPAEAPAAEGPANPPATGAARAPGRAAVTARAATPAPRQASAAKPAAAAAEPIAAPLPTPVASPAAADPQAVAATPFTRQWFAARPDAWRPDRGGADWWRPADVTAITGWLAGAAVRAADAADAGDAARGVEAAGGAAAAVAGTDGLQSVLVLPTGKDAAEGGREAAAAWLPLGVFAVVPPGGTAEVSQQILFVDRTGAIRGNFHDPLSDTVQPVAGVVDLAAGRASWTVGAGGSRFECPLAEFTAFPGKVSVTAGGRVRVLDLVPIPAP